jgi:hypothetical protein
MRYYFDIRHGSTLIPDEEGVELPNLEQVQLEAARSLVDALRHAEALRATDGVSQPYTVEVRDESGPVLTVLYTYGAGGQLH